MRFLLRFCSSGDRSKEVMVKGGVFESVSTLGVCAWNCVWSMSVRVVMELCCEFKIRKSEISSS